VRAGSVHRRAVLVAVAALAGCWVPIERGRQMEARIERLEVKSVEQQSRLDEQREIVRDRVAGVDEKIREVQAKIDELNKAARRSGADLGVSLSRLEEEFSRVKGELEVEQHRLAELEKGVKTLSSDTEARFAALGAGALDAYEARQRIATLEEPDDKAAFFALAEREEEQGDRGIARELYEEYVRRWPSDPRSAEAGFRAGQLLLEQKRFRQALLAFGKVAEGFSRSGYAPDAMLGAAESMLALEMESDARSVLEELIRKYPKSAAAANAKRRLAELPRRRRRHRPRTGSRGCRRGWPEKGSAHASGAPERFTSVSIIAQAFLAPATKRTPTVAVRPDCAVQQTTLRKLATWFPAPRRTSIGTPTAGTDPDQARPHPFSDTEYVVM